MKLRKSIFLGIVWGVCSSVLAFGVGKGAGSSGGGDYLRADVGSAWFVGPRAIRYCYTLDKNFGVPAPTIESTLRKSFSIWQEYLKEKGLNHWDPKWSLVFNHERVPCDGSEDLKFYFGVSTYETNQIKANYSNPTAFSYRTSYDPVALWGKGLVWVAPPGSVIKNLPDWTLPDKLTIQLLHEMGHVLGCDHVEGTVMTARIASEILYINHLKPTVDHTRMLLFGSASEPMKIPGLINQPGREAGDAALFRKFIGRDPVGQIRATLHFDQATPAHGAKLVYSDDVSESSIILEPLKSQRAETSSSISYSEQVVFKIAFESAVSPGELYSTGFYNNPAETYYGRIRDAKGNVYSSLIEINLVSALSKNSAGPISVWFIDLEQNQRYVLFSSRYWPKIGE